jgi:uncharacterized membrane protein YraQ (UPF0718 family)
MSEASCPANTQGNKHPARVYLVSGIVLLLLVVTGLIIYKADGSFKRISSGEPPKPTALTSGEVFAVTLKYFEIVWPALLFGILIGALVRAFLSPAWVMKILGGVGGGKQVVAGLAGAPLMLCSCCVTPIFTGVYERGAKLGPSIALMLGSPGLNPAVLIFTFVIFSFNPLIGVARVVLTLLAVFVLAALVGKMFERESGERTQERLKKLMAKQSEEIRSWSDFLLKFLKSVVYLSLVTIPLIAAGVILSSLLLPTLGQLNQMQSVITIGAVALISVLIAVPTFFEIPLALMLLHMGAPTGAAVAMLFAGPIVNLPSLFVLARETNVKVSMALGTGLLLLALLGGLVV